MLTEGTQSAPAPTEGAAPSPASESPQSAPEAQPQGEGVAEQPTEPPSEEGQTEEPQQKGKKELDFHKRFAALSRREQQLIERERQLKEQYSEVEKVKKAREQFNDDPLGYLDSMGMSFEDLANRILGEKKEDTPESKYERILEHVQKLEKQMEDREKQAEEAEKSRRMKQAEETIDTFKRNINTFVDNNAEKYELIKVNEAQDLVYDVIEEHFNKTNKVIPLEQAADEVEKYFESQYKDKLLKTKKLSSIVSQRDEKPEKPAEQPSAAPQESKDPYFPTLTNSQLSSSPVAQDDTARAYQDAEESKRQIAEWLKKQINN